MNAYSPTTAAEQPRSVRPSLTSAPRPRPARHMHAQLDRLSMWLSALCAVHCAVMPVVLVFLPVVSWIRWSRTMDVVVLALSALLGVSGCLLSLRHHRTTAPLCLVIAGLLTNGVGRWAQPWLGPVMSQTLIIAGPLLMAYGLWKDKRLCACHAARSRR